jgi:uncharacterized protein YozE (UPF0346 family)
MRYKQWLLEQTDRQDPIGDLARDASEDEEFPGALHEIKDYLYLVGACDGALEAFESSVKEYRNLRGEKFPKIKY